MLPASEDDVIHVFRWVSSATSTVLLELRRGNLSLYLSSEQFVVELMLYVLQVCRKRILELESERAADLQIPVTPRVPRSSFSTSTSIYDQPMVFPDLDFDTQDMYSLRERTE